MAVSNGCKEHFWRTKDCTECQQLEQLAPKTFYRFDAYLCGGFVEIVCNTYSYVKETPCGFWIKQNTYFNDKERWVPKISKKRFAYPTKEEAWTNFILRKKRYIEILTARLQTANKILNKALNSGMPK